MKYLTIVLLITFLIYGCQKEGRARHTTCYKGRYVGAGCWSVLQLLEPLDGSLPTAPYGVYENTVGTGSLPERFKDGKPFYFTVSQVDSNKIYLTYCMPTKYFITLSTFSDSACAFAGQ
jgi:hypothetical protein